MHGEYLGARPTLGNGGGPVEAREHFPDLVVDHFVGIEAGEQVAAAKVGEGQHGLVVHADALRAFVVEDDRHEFVQFAVHQREVVAAAAGHKNEAAALLLDEALD